MMVDTVRGVLRVRKWPKKYGKARSALQQYWIDWFKQANLLAKYADPMSQRRAIEMTKGSGLYPRDVLLSAMRGRLYVWIDDTGWKWYPMAAIQDISDSLDVLAQTVGDVLVRATDRWRAPPAGSINDVLTHQGAGASPIWAPSAGGGGVVQAELGVSPIVPDGTIKQYDIDVTGYAFLDIGFKDVDLSASGYPIIRLSIDGGATWKQTGGDYEWINVSPTTGSNSVTSGLICGYTASTVGHSSNIHLSGLQVRRSFYQGVAGKIGNAPRVVSGATLFDGPITDIRIEATGSGFFNSGTITLFGTLKG